MVSNISCGMNIFKMVVGIALLFTAIISGEASAQIINTVAGNGVAGFSGDGGPAVQAQLNAALDVAVRTDGSFYIAEYYNHRIRRVGPDGIITTVAGNGIAGFSGDGGPAVQAQLDHPNGVGVGSDGSLYIADYYNHRIRHVGLDGIITTVAGNGNFGFGGDGGPAVQAQLAYPNDVAVGSDGSLYIASPHNNSIRRVGPDGIITTVAGNGVSGFSGDGGPAVQAQLDDASRVAVDSDGSLYIADVHNLRIRRVGPDGIITTIAGNGNSGFSGDGGPATQAQIGYPQSVAIGSDGSFYIADYYHHRIRHVGPDSIITTVAGNGEAGFGGDGGPALQAQLYYPVGLSVGSDGSLYIADNSHRIRRVSFDITPPSIVCDNADGIWHGTDVSIACTASDGSGLANPTDANFSLSTNVADGVETSSALTNSRNVCDMAENCATAGPISGNMVDKKAPSISILIPITAGTYTLNQAIVASYSCNDGGSL